MRMFLLHVYRQDLKLTRRISSGNAADLIDEYWKNVAKRGKKSADKSKPAKAGRKSTARDTSPDASASVAKKRGRSKAKKEESDAEGDSDGGRPSTAKRARKSSGKSTKRSSSAAAMDVDEPFGNMHKYMTQESWEKLIKTVDTVEKGEDGQLYVYFTL